MKRKLSAFDRGWNAGIRKVTKIVRCNLIGAASDGCRMNTLWKIAFELRGKAPEHKMGEADMIR